MNSVRMCVCVRTHFFIRWNCRRILPQPCESGRTLRQLLAGYSQYFHPNCFDRHSDRESTNTGNSSKTSHLHDVGISLRFRYSGKCQDQELRRIPNGMVYMGWSPNYQTPPTRVMRRIITPNYGRSITVSESPYMVSKFDRSFAGHRHVRIFRITNATAQTIALRRFMRSWTCLQGLGIRKVKFNGLLTKRKLMNSFLIFEQAKIDGWTTTVNYKSSALPERDYQIIELRVCWKRWIFTKNPKWRSL